MTTCSPLCLTLRNDRLYDFPRYQRRCGGTAMKEAKKYINHHKVKLSGKWYITKVRASEAVEIAFEEGKNLCGKRNFRKKKSDLYIISERSNPGPWLFSIGRY